MDHIETKIISSTEFIKPSSPTPKSLQKHHLSFLDQINPPIFSTSIYFYSSTNKIPNSQKSKTLKKSLSEVLSRFYPLAGRRVGNLYVDCNDEGAPFFEAEADCDLSSVITNPNPKHVTKFVPYKFDENLNLCMAVQVTYFRCGGIAVGTLISHKVADGSSMIMFANAWSAAARGGIGSVMTPKFDGAVYFPPRDMPAIHDPTHWVKKGEFVSKIFTFPAAKITGLQERYAAGLPGRRPTRVETLSAYISTRVMSGNPNRIKYLLHALDLRTRLGLPLPASQFGNLCGGAVSAPAAGDGGVEIIKRVREAVKTAVKKDSDDDVNDVMAAYGKTFGFTSLIGFPVYEVDFGWGKPVWFGMDGSTLTDFAVFNVTKCGGGIEALITLPKQDMDKFEADLEIQPFLISRF